MSTLTTATSTPDAVSSTSISPGQQAFITALETKVANFLESKLDGPFQAVSYPAGFHQILMVGNFGYYNANTLLDIDKLVDQGQPLSLDPTETFSSLYAKLLGASTFQFSAADQALISKEEGDAQQAVAGVLQAYTDEVGPFTPGSNELAAVYTWLATNYQNDSDNLPAMYSGLQNALETYEGKAVNSTRLHKLQSEGVKRLNAAVANITTPSATNGGMPISATTWYPGYVLPDGQNLSGSLEAPGNSVELTVAVNNFSASSSQVSISGGGSFELPIEDIFTFSAGGSTTYNASQYSSSDASMNIDIVYEGVTPFAVAPMGLSLDTAAPGGSTGTGWYDPEIIKALVANTGQDTTGYALLSTSEYPVAEYFGTGAAFAHLRTFVLSQQPTITMTFSGSNASQVSSDLTVNTSTEVDFLGLFPIGGTSSSYQTSSVDSKSVQGSVIVKFGPTPVTTDPDGQVAFVMGGVVSYPPAS